MELWSYGRCDRIRFHNALAQFQGHIPLYLHAIVAGTTRIAKVADLYGVLTRLTVECWMRMRKSEMEHPL
jgi:hypothetical protein